MKIKNETTRKNVEKYIDWFFSSNTEPYDELEWLIGLLLDSKHSEIINEMLNIYSIEND